MSGRSGDGAPVHPQHVRRARAATSRRSGAVPARVPPRARSSTCCRRRSGCPPGTAGELAPTRSEKSTGMHWSPRAWRVAYRARVEDRERSRGLLLGVGEHRARSRRSPARRRRGRVQEQHHLDAARDRAGRSRGPAEDLFEQLDRIQIDASSSHTVGQWVAAAGGSASRPRRIRGRRPAPPSRGRRALCSSACSSSPSAVTTSIAVDALAGRPEDARQPAEAALEQVARRAPRPGSGRPGRTALARAASRPGPSPAPAGCTTAVRASASTDRSVRRERSSSMPPSRRCDPAQLWPPERTPIRMPSPRRQLHRLHDVLLALRPARSRRGSDRRCARSTRSPCVRPRSRRLRAAARSCELLVQLGQERARGSCTPPRSGARAPWARSPGPGAGARRGG